MATCNRRKKDYREGSNDAVTKLKKTCVLNATTWSGWSGSGDATQKLREIYRLSINHGRLHQPFNRYAWVLLHDQDPIGFQYYSAQTVKLGTRWLGWRSSSCQPTSKIAHFRKCTFSLHRISLQLLHFTNLDEFRPTQTSREDNVLLRKTIYPPCYNSHRNHRTSSI